MKITRMKQGYIIRLSDSDYAMLENVVVDGLMSQEGDDMARDHWSPREKAAFTRREKRWGRFFMAVDEDRRGSCK